MSASIETFTADGHIVLTFPESAMQPEAREEFIAFAKAEWTARQSRFTEGDARTLASEIDSGWWSKNKDRILRYIGEA